MKKNLTLILFIVSLIGISIFVSAYEEHINGDDDNIIYTASVSKGWNLLNGGVYSNRLTANSDIKEKDISAIYVYSPSQNEYLQIYPNLDEEKLNIEDKQSAKIHLIESSSAWVYIQRDGMIEYEVGDMVSIRKRELVPGWNFISVTESALGQTLNNLKGNCDIQSAYYYFKEYKKLDLNMEFPNDMSSLGLIIKVPNKCKFGGNSIMPPQIPN